MTADYPKKFGLIRRRITPDAPSNARAAITLPMILVPLAYHSSLSPDAAIITPATMIAMNDARRITVTSILVNQSISAGKAVSPVTCIVVVEVFRNFLSCNIFFSAAESIWIHLPMKGTVVLRLIPQQTPDAGTQITFPSMHLSHLSGSGSGLQAASAVFEGVAYGISHLFVAELYTVHGASIQFALFRSVC